MVLKYVPKKEGVGKPQTHTRELNGDEFILVSIGVWWCVCHPAVVVFMMTEWRMPTLA